MLDYIKGKLISTATLKGASIIVENNGLGYFINTTVRTINNLPQADTDIKVYTTLIHKEDSMTLCGFISHEDRDIFNILQSVSGVGVKVALVLLDEFSGCDLIAAVIRGDYKELSKAKGIGPKLAQKIILELKDKLINWQKTSPIDMSDVTGEIPVSSESVSEVQAVLISLGYSAQEAKNSIKLACANACKKNSSEEILKEALKYLAQGQ